MHLLLEVLLLLPLHNRGRPDGGEVLGVDRLIVAKGRGHSHLAWVDLGRHRKYFVTGDKSRSKGISFGRKGLRLHCELGTIPDTGTRYYSGQDTTVTCD